MNTYSDVNKVIEELENISIQIHNDKYNVVFDLVNTMFGPFIKKKFKCLTQVNYIFEEDIILYKNHCDSVLILFFDKLLQHSLIDEDTNMNVKTTTILNKILKKINLRMKSSSIDRRKYYYIQNI